MFIFYLLYDIEIYVMSIADARARKFTPNAALPRVEILRHGVLFVVPDSDPNGNDLFDHFAFGHFTGPFLVLSPFEVFFLAMLNSDVTAGLTVQDLWIHCSSLFPATVFARHYAVYHYYRCKLWVVRDGSVFGAHFVLYPDHQDLVHSKFMVIVVDDWGERNSEILRVSRITSAVQKSAVLVHVNVPTDANFETPGCLSTFSIEDVTVRRVKVK
jgi:tRNA-intron lyase